MTKAIIYLRSATGNRDQVRQQEADCRAYLRERDLVDVGTVTDTGHPQDGLTTVIDTAVKAEATEVVVTDISRLGRRPLAATRNVDALDEAGLTLPAASGTLSGPVLDECIRDMMYEFTLAGARRIHGDTESES